jgi:hypothetical protein
MMILDKIERQDYDVFGRRPAISRSDRALLLLRTLVRAAFTRTS